MGAGSSTLPAKLTEADLQKLCGQLYNSFRDADGFIDREALIHAAFSGQEKEVHDLFMSFANVDGLMDTNGFSKLCRAAKLMNKTNFLHSDAVRVFERSRMTVNLNNGRTSKNTSVINYNIFRTLLMPDISSMKQIHLDNLIFRLSRVEERPPLLFIPLPKDDDLGAILVDDVDFEDDEAKEHAESKTGSTGEALEINVQAKQEKEHVDVLNHLPLTPVQQKAVHRIQSVSRRLIAKHIVEEIRTVSFSSFYFSNSVIHLGFCLTVQLLGVCCYHVLFLYCSRVMSYCDGRGDGDAAADDDSDDDAADDAEPSVSGERCQRRIAMPIFSTHISLYCSDSVLHRSKPLLCPYVKKISIKHLQEWTSRCAYRECSRGIAAMARWIALNS